MRKTFVTLAAAVAVGFFGAGCATTDPGELGQGCGACSNQFGLGFCVGCCTGDAGASATPAPTKMTPRFVPTTQATTAMRY